MKVKIQVQSHFGIQSIIIPTLADITLQAWGERLNRIKAKTKTEPSKIKGKNDI